MICVRGAGRGGGFPRTARADSCASSSDALVVRLYVVKTVSSSTKRVWLRGINRARTNYASFNEDFFQWNLCEKMVKISPLFVRWLTFLTHRMRVETCLAIVFVCKADE